MTQAQPEKQTFKIFIRQYASGHRYALSDTDVENEISFDDVVGNDKVEGPYREFCIDVTSRPPALVLTDAIAHVDVPDDAELSPPTAAAA